MKRVAIIGAGPIGASTARALAEREVVAEICLVDDEAAVAAGKALDILQSGAIDGSDTRLTGTASLDVVTGADVVVLADRAGVGGEWTGDAALQLVRRLSTLAGRAPIVFAGPLQRDLVRAAHRELGVAASRLVGSAPEALASCARALLAATAGAASSEVRVPILGTPASWMIAWSQASIGGRGAADILPAVALSRVDALVRASWPPGPYACGAAAASIVRVMATGSARSMTVFTPVEHALDVRRAVVAMPVRLGASGVTEVETPSLSSRERVLLDNVLVP
jgi:malate dehydrogenase